MKMCQIKQTLKLRLAAAIAMTAVVIVGCIAPTANAQGWPFSDAPEPVLPSITQTANVSSLEHPPTSVAKPGVIMSAEALDLGQDEVVVSGDRILRETGIIGAGTSQYQSTPARPIYDVGPRRNQSRRFGPRYSYDCYTGCPTGCPPAFYGGFETLYIEHEVDRFNYSNVRDANLGNYDFELGTRLTFGRMCNCTDGYELVWTGMLEWERIGGNQSTTGTIDFSPTPVAPFTTTNLDALYATESISQRFAARYSSYEANHRTSGWDVISTVMGLKVIDYDENFDYLARNPAPGNEIGQFSQDIDNFLIGGHVGIDMLWPVLRRLMVGSRIRGGVYANLAEVKTTIINDGTFQMRNSDSFTELAVSFDYGVFTTFHILPCLSVKAGYEFWYLDNMATVAAQVSPSLGTAYGTGQATDSVFFHGATVGVEAVF